MILHKEFSMKRPYRFLMEKAVNFQTDSMLHTKVLSTKLCQPGPEYPIMPIPGVGIFPAEKDCLDMFCESFARRPNVRGKTRSWKNG